MYYKIFITKKGLLAACVCLQGEIWFGAERLSGLHDRVEEQEERGDTRRYDICKETKKRPHIP
jgi:hypothetical protein